MRLTTLFALVLPALAAGQAQKPLTDQMKNWFSVATSSLFNAIPSAVPTVPEAIKSPAAAAAAKAAPYTIYTLTMRNYEDVLAVDSAKPEPTEWMVLISGGNKTCAGHCHKIEVDFNETAAILAADATAPKLGYINCDQQGVLCATWTARPPTIWWISRPHPRPGQEVPPESSIRITYPGYNGSSVQDLVALHTGKKYEEGYLLESIFQPFDGQLKQYGINKIVGYIYFALSSIPSWGYMLAVSMFTRNVM